MSSGKIETVPDRRRSEKLISSQLKGSQEEDDKVDDVSLVLRHLISIFDTKSGEKKTLKAVTRRKSCSCTECGGISKKEIKTMDIAYEVKPKVKQEVKTPETIPKQRNFFKFNFSPITKPLEPKSESSISLIENSLKKEIKRETPVKTITGIKMNLLIYN